MDLDVVVPIVSGERALGRLVEAEQEYMDEFGRWNMTDFNRWLIERYGVAYIYSDARYHCKVVDPDRYLFFLLKWP